jgi:hypothetical protein
MDYELEVDVTDELDREQLRLIGATSISRHLCYRLILDSDIWRREAPSVDERHYEEWKEREHPA